MPYRRRMGTDDANLVETWRAGDRSANQVRPGLLTIALCTLACGDSDDMRVDSSTAVTGVTGASSVTLGTSAPTGGSGQRQRR
jgi:hypothetical protein